MEDKEQDLDPKLTRRGFLKVAFVAMLVSAASLVGLDYLLKDHPFYSKLKRSVSSGNIWQDILEVIDSQTPKEESLKLGEKDNYNDDWLKKFFPERHFFKISGEEHRNIAFLEITGNGNIVVAKAIGEDISKMALDKPFMFLPTPQGNPDSRYTMYAVFNRDGRVINASPTPRSNERGGIIVQDGKTQVGLPEISEYKNFDSTKTNSALVEYFCVLDSKNLLRGIAELEKIPSLSGIKNFRNVEAFSSAIVTFSSPDGNFKTFVMTSYRELDPATNSFIPETLGDFTIPQLASLAKEFLGKNQAFNRFLIAFPDPGPGQYLVTSENTSLVSIPNKFVTKTVPVDTSSVLHRTLGGNGSVSSVYRPQVIDKPAYVVVKPN
jgi:hypothetical protein